MSIDFEDEFANFLDTYSLMLQEFFEKLKSERFSLDNLDYSRLIANRVRAYYQAQDKAKTYLSKKKAQSGSDFFVETFLFTLKLFIETEGLNLELASEKSLQKKKKSIFPDISLWRGDTCVCAIECKTQLGYQRHSWLSQFEDREKKLREVFPESKMFLLVMTSNNWLGFDVSDPKAGLDKSDSRVGEKFFCLLGRYPNGKGIWPIWMPEDLSEEHFQHPIEQLLAKIQLL
ncbi:MAG: hypothetical protein AAGD25_21925 [Cyanobacteria bacterium P01_F01_bin.150]